MDIRTTYDNGVTHFALTGRLDTNTAPRLDEALKALDESSGIILDFTGLEYLSSAGLRVIFAAQKRTTAAKGSLRIRNINESVMEVFELTGFSDFLTLE